MSYPISIKVEKAITLDFLTDALDIDGLNIYEGHEKVAEIAFPNLVIYAEGSSPHPDFPTECGVRVVRLRAKFTVDSEVHTRGDLNAWKELLEIAMTNDLGALQAILNKPVGTDDRTVKEVHFQDVVMTDDPGDVNETDWIEDLAFDVTVEPLDS